MIPPVGIKKIRRGERGERDHFFFFFWGGGGIWDFGISICNGRFQMFNVCLARNKECSLIVGEVLWHLPFHDRSLILWKTSFFTILWDLGTIGFLGLWTDFWRKHDQMLIECFDVVIVSKTVGY